MNNKEIIKEYEQHRIKIDQIKKTTATTEKFILETLDKKINKPFKKTTQQDILTYLNDYKPNSRDSRINHLKIFYRWLFNLEKEDKLPDCIRNIRPTPYRLKRIKGDVAIKDRRITLNEYHKMLDYANTVMHKALIETLYHFGPRISELLSMNSNDVIYDGEITKVTFRESKTQARDAVYYGRLNHLMNWVESYQPFKGEKYKPLWVDHRTNKRYCKRSALGLVHRICKRAGIQRRKLHDFRHSSISNDRDNGISITHIETNHGLVHGSLMMKIYDHNKTIDYVEYLRKKNNETPATYESLEKQKELLEEKHEKEIQSLKLLGRILFDTVNTIIDETMLETIKNKYPPETYKVLEELFNQNPNLLKEYNKALHKT